MMMLLDFAEGLALDSCRNGAIAMGESTEIIAEPSFMKRPAGTATKTFGILNAHTGARFFFIKSRGRQGDGAPSAPRSQLIRAEVSELALI